MLDTVTQPASIALDRQQLSDAFRLAERFGFHEGICNHFSVRLDSEDELYLIDPYGTHWSEMTPEALLLIDGNGDVLEGDGMVEDTAKFIHISGHRANARHKAILHTHMPYATTLTMLAGGRLEMAHQTAVRFHQRIDYVDTFGGLALSADEGDRLAATAKEKPHVDVTFLSQHGVVVGGPTVGRAFDDLYYLERAARQQVLAMQTGRELKLIPDDVVELTARQMAQDVEKFADEHFNALSRVIANNPDHPFTF